MRAAHQPTREPSAVRLLLERDSVGAETVDQNGEETREHELETMPRSKPIFWEEGGSAENRIDVLT